MAIVVSDLLQELNLSSKLLTITGDNASNDEVLISELHAILLDQHDTTEHPLGNDLPSIRFEGQSSYIRCIAHVINLIVGHILIALKSGDNQSANLACEALKANKDLDPELSPLASLRIVVLWIDRSPQRRNRWKRLCRLEELPEKIIQYDVSTRWNSTYQMLKDSLGSYRQIRRFMEVESMGLPAFTTQDWNQLRQLRDILSKFDEFTRLVSHTKPQLSLSIALYYELEELFQDASNREGLFKDADQVLVSAVRAGLGKYEKYFVFVDKVNTYYIAMILDPRFKCELLKQELEDDVAASFLITQLRDFLHRHYPPENEPQSPSHLPPSNEANSSTELRLLQKLHAPSRNVSDIDRYFDDGIISVAITTLMRTGCLSGGTPIKESMARAARDFLPLPASEVACERLFSSARDLLGLRRHRMNGETMRLLTLLKNSYDSSD